MRSARFAVLAFVAMAAWCTPSALADRAFTGRFSTNDTGDIVIASSSLMTCPTAAAGCVNARNLIGDNNALINNSYAMTRVDTDGDAATTIDSSTATLTLPAGATVLFAGLYWGADRTGGTGGAAPPAPAAANTVKLRPPGGVYRTLTASQMDFGTGANTQRFQGFVDVTATVAAAGGGTYAVGDVQAGTGADRYAGWALVVAYRDTSQPARNLTVIDGYRSIASTEPPTTIPVTGFRTPPAGPVRTSLGFITYEGDAGLVGDTATLNGVSLSNAANPATNFFNSSISALGVRTTTRTPADPNAFGYDADLLRADGILANDATSATIGVTTSGDQYLPGVVTFATDLFAPAVGLTKSVQNVTHPGGPDQRGDVLRYTVTAANTGQDGADDFALTDAIPTGSSYVPGSLRQSAGAGAPATFTDAGADDRAELDAAGGRVAFRLGTGATAARGGRLAAGASATVTFDVRIADVPPRTTIVNAAAASFVAQSLRTPLASDSNQVENVVAAPNLTLAKSHTPEFVGGSGSTFRLVASNLGNLATDGTLVTVSDTFPAGAAGFDVITSAGGAGWSCAVAATTVTCTRSDVLAAGASYPPILVDATVHDPPPASITNVATVAGGGDADPSDNSAVDVGSGSTAADLRLTKTVAPGSAAFGARVAYTLRIENLGPSVAQGVGLADPLPAGLGAPTVTTTRGTCTVAVTCTIGALAPGESADVTVEATITANATTITNVATVSSSTPDPVPGNDTAQATVDVPNSANLRVLKTASPANPVAGQPNGLTYTVTAINDGPGAADAVLLLDDLPAVFTPTAVVPPAAWTCAPPAGTEISCTRSAPMPAGASEAFSITGTVAANAGGAPIVNAARVSSPTIDPDPTDNGTTSTVLPAQVADLAATKEFGASCATFTAIAHIAPNTAACVRLTVTNLGPSPATGVTLVDPLPVGVVYVSDNQAACTHAAGVVTCAVGALAPGAQFSALVTVNVTGAAAGTTVVNTATADGAQDDPVPANDTATDRLAVGTAADLVLTKTLAPAAPAAGAEVTMTLTVVNGGPSPAPGVVISDPLPVGLAFVSSAGCTYDAAPAPNGVVTCAVGTLANGASATRSAVLRALPATAGTDLTNRATVASTGPGAVQDPDPSTNAAEAVVSVGRLADLSLTKTASTPTVPIDGNVTYTLSVANAGPNDAEAVVVTDRVPAELDYVAAPGCAFAANLATVTCALGTVPAGTTVTRTITLHAGVRAAGLTALNDASVASADPDPTPGDTRAQAPVTVGQQIDLRVAKTASAASVEAGAALTYTIVVTNAGPSSATGMVLNDDLPAGVTPLGATPSQGTCTVTGSNVTCALGTIAADGAAQVVVPVTVGAALAGTTVTNTAAARADQPEARPQDDAGSVTTTVTAPPTTGPTGTATGASLRLTKTADRGSATPGSRLTWTLVVTNDGPGAAVDVVVTDTIAGPVRVLSATGAPATCSVAGRVTTCRLAALAAGASVTLRVVGEVTGTGAVANTATATSSTVDPSPAGVATATTTTPLRAGTARLVVRKVGSAARTRAGGLVRYRITVRNTGPDAALDVSVCERLPGALTYVAAPGARFRRGNACWTVAMLRSGQQRTYTVQVRADLLDGDRRVVNRAAVTARNAAPRIAAARLLILGGRPGGGGVAVTG